MFAMTVSDPEQHKGLFQEYNYFELLCNRQIKTGDVVDFHVFQMVRLYRCICTLKLKIVCAQPPKTRRVFGQDDYHQMEAYVKIRNKEERQLAVLVKNEESCSRYSTNLEHGGSEELVREVDKFMWTNKHKYSLAGEVGLDPDSDSDDEEDQEKHSDEDDDKKLPANASQPETKFSVHTKYVDSMLLRKKEKLSRIVAMQLKTFATGLRTEIEQLKQKQSHEIKQIEASCKDVRTVFSTEFACGKLRSTHPFPACFSSLFDLCKCALYLEVLNLFRVLYGTWKFKSAFDYNVTRTIQDRLVVCEREVFTPISDNEFIQRSGCPDKLVQTYCTLTKRGDLSSVVYAILVRYSRESCQTWLQSIGGDSFTTKALDVLLTLTEMWTSVLRAAMDLVAIVGRSKQYKGSIQYTEEHDSEPLYTVSLPSLALVDVLHRLLEAGTELQTANRETGKFGFLQKAGLFPQELLFSILQAACRFAISVNICTAYRLHEDEKDTAFVEEEEWDAWSAAQLERGSEDLVKSIKRLFTKSANDTYFDKDMDEASCLAWQAIQATKGIKATNDAALSKKYTEAELKEHTSTAVVPFTYEEQVKATNETWVKFHKKFSGTLDGVALPIKKEPVIQAYTSILSTQF